MCWVSVSPLSYLPNAKCVSRHNFGTKGNGHLYFKIIYYLSLGVLKVLKSEPDIVYVQLQFSFGHFIYMVEIFSRLENSGMTKYRTSLDYDLKAFRPPTSFKWVCISYLCFQSPAVTLYISFW